MNQEGSDGDHDAYCPCAVCQQRYYTMHVLESIPDGYVSGKGKGRQRDSEMLKTYSVLDKNGKLEGLSKEVGKQLAQRFRNWVKADTNGKAILRARINAKNGTIGLFVLANKNGKA